MRLIGLTGGIATGKTTVDRMLAARGASVIDADELAREVVRPGEPALAAVAMRFGREVIRSDGSLDRDRLGKLVFADPEARRDLEQITHPRIAELTSERVAAALAGPAPLVVVDIPLLFENSREALFEGVLLVYAPTEVQVLRLRERNGLEEAAALQRLAAQLPIEEKRNRATWIIDNSDGLDETSRAVDRWWETTVR
ncbi:MAG TPA: dephospho-CoA kinase [Candidatus Saccharimonadales bacterium]|nr:dephospho-CoA kinase [Candidatus Saccharimonadales bacterium]